MDDLYIKYDNGEMLIHMNAFFPCSQSRLNKLLKVIELDWQHETELKEKLKVYFQNKIAESGNLQLEAGASALEWNKKIAGINILIATKKKANGEKFTKDELKQKKEDLRYYKAMARNTLSAFKQHERNKAQYQKNLKLL